MPEYTWKSVPLSAMSFDQLHTAAIEMADLIAAMSGRSPALVELDAASPGEGDEATFAQAIARQIVKLKGYFGEPCPECLNFTLVRNGTCLRCDTCGATTGCS